MRVFLEANILFCAAMSDGAVRALVNLLLDRGHECQVDEYVVAETAQPRLGDDATVQSIASGAGHRDNQIR